MARGDDRSDASTCEALIIAAVFLLFTNTFVVQTFYIPSGSMEDTLLIGDHLFVNRFIYGPTPTAPEQKLLPFRPVQRGDIVVFRSPENPDARPRQALHRPSAATRVQVIDTAALHQRQGGQRRELTPCTRTPTLGRGDFADLAHCGCGTTSGPSRCRPATTSAWATTATTPTTRGSGGRAGRTSSRGGRSSSTGPTAARPRPASGRAWARRSRTWADRARLLLQDPLGEVVPPDPLAVAVRVGPGCTPRNPCSGSTWRPCSSRSSSRPSPAPGSCRRSRSRPARWRRTC